jgi:hypothetical protein
MAMMRLSRRAFVGGAALLPWMATAQGTAGARFAPSFPRERAIADFFLASESNAQGINRLYMQRGSVAPQLNETLRSVDEYAALLTPGTGPYSYPRGSALLFYLSQGATLTAWLVGPTGLLAASRQPIAPTALTQAARDLRFWLRVDGRGVSRAPVFRNWNDEEDSDAVVAADLSEARVGLARMVLPPEIRHGLRGIEHLVIVGNGAIGSIPFAMLPLDRRTLLIDRASITMAAGLFDLRRPVPHWSAAAAFANPLIFGDPLVPADPMAIEVPPLPGARVEAEAFARLVGKRAQLGQEATKQAFLDRWLNSSMLYVAAHGVANPRDPLNGGFLMLSGPDPAAAYMTARDVLPEGLAIRVDQDPELRLNAHLVVLSACQSGLGMLHDGGVIGLARSFQKRGAPRVLMSLWSVSDDATVALMDRFSRAALTMAPAAALRNAMLAMRRRNPDPKLWAPFVVFGTPR